MFSILKSDQKALPFEYYTKARSLFHDPALYVCSLAQGSVAASASEAVPGPAQPPLLRGSSPTGPQPGVDMASASELAWPLGVHGTPSVWPLLPHLPPALVLSYHGCLCHPLLSFLNHKEKSTISGFLKAKRQHLPVGCDSFGSWGKDGWKNYEECFSSMWQYWPRYTCENPVTPPQLNYKRV